nr:bifunctional transcriptional activator/dna repair enzyme adaa [Quercus suber]
MSERQKWKIALEVTNHNTNKQEAILLVDRMLVVIDLCRKPKISFRWTNAEGLASQRWAQLNASFIMSGFVVFPDLDLLGTLSRILIIICYLWSRALYGEVHEERWKLESHLIPSTRLVSYEIRSRLDHPGLVRHGLTAITTMMTSPAYQSAHSRWLALTRRDRSAHSSFLYGVKSTRIYCRPTCSARLARRANIIFYDDEIQAQHDGFRPCKRCKPDDAAFFGEGEELVTRIMALLWIVRDAPSMSLSLKTISKELQVTPSYLCRVFKRVMGLTIGEYAKNFDGVISEATFSSHPPSISAGLEEFHYSTSAPRMDSASVLKRNLQNQSIQGATNVPEDIDTDFDLDEWVWTGLLD